MSEDTQSGLAELAQRTYSILQTSFGADDLQEIKTSYLADAKPNLEQRFESWYFAHGPHTILLWNKALWSGETFRAVTAEREHQMPLFAASAYSFYKQIVDEPDPARAMLRLAAYPHHLILRELLSSYQVSPWALDKYVGRTTMPPASARELLGDLRSGIEARLAKPTNGSSSPSSSLAFIDGESYVSALFAVNAKLNELP